ncbi:Rieske 2Fe-2S domain-containing protein [Variovorax boronicumulans]|uniref:Rieske 2Fe-2S domain-containing protein n=1 Tax=Variovorax boronicumulans TaxID=436515 RepID=UPI001C5811E7
MKLADIPLRVEAAADPLDQFRWPNADYTRTPYRVFTDEAIYQREMARVFRGPTWNYLALEAEVPETGSFKTVQIGNVPVVVSRNAEGKVTAFVNRCAHRGATVVRQEFGKADGHACIYHQWNYDSSGELCGVPYRRGLNGCGGYPKDFKPAEHGLEKLRVALYKGLVFGSFSDEAPPLLDYLGAHIVTHIDRIFVKPLKVLGYHRQRISANWKLYFENIKDPYHAGLLHTFMATFGVYRSTQKGHTLVSPGGGHAVVYSITNTDNQESVLEAYKGTDNKYQADFALKAPGLLQWTPDFHDGIGNLIVSVFPNMVIHQILNTFATRQVRPLGRDAMELYWTYFGFEDDAAERTAARLQQLNLVGPAGYISMEDGEAIRLVQQSIRGEKPDATSFIEMGGRGPIVDADHVVTEVCTRGLWQQYAHTMGFAPEVSA